MAIIWIFSFCSQRSSGLRFRSKTKSKNSNTNGNSSASAATGSNSKQFDRFRCQFLETGQKNPLGKNRPKVISTKTFGVDLSEHLQKFCSHITKNDTYNIFPEKIVDQNSFSVELVPNVVRTCTEFIEKNGIIFGIYRLSGMRVNIQKLRTDFESNPQLTTIESETICNDSHAVACVLKQYFRELPNPLLTYQLYDKILALFKSELSFDSCVRDSSVRTNRAFSPDARVMAASLSFDGNKSISMSPSAPSNLTTIGGTAQKFEQTPINLNEKLVMLKDLLTNQLPPSHFYTLKFLMKHLACIAANGQKTGMDSKNVAIVWAPNLLKPREIELTGGWETLQMIGTQAVIIEQMIKNHEFLFSSDDQSNNLNNSSIISKVDLNDIQNNKQNNLSNSPDYLDVVTAMSEPDSNINNNFSNDTTQDDTTLADMDTIENFHTPFEVTTSDIEITNKEDARKYLDSGKMTPEISDLAKSANHPSARYFDHCDTVSNFHENKLDSLTVHKDFRDSILNYNDCRNSNVNYADLKTCPNSKENCYDFSKSYVNISTSTNDNLRINLCSDRQTSNSKVNFQNKRPASTHLHHLAPQNEFSSNKNSLQHKQQQFCNNQSNNKLSTSNPILSSSSSMADFHSASDLHTLTND